MSEATVGAEKQLFSSLWIDGWDAKWSFINAVRFPIAPLWGRIKFRAWKTFKNFSTASHFVTLTSFRQITSPKRQFVNVSLHQYATLSKEPIFFSPQNIRHGKKRHYSKNFNIYCELHTIFHKTKKFLEKCRVFARWHFFDQITLFRKQSLFEAEKTGPCGEVTFLGIDAIVKWRIEVTPVWRSDTFSLQNWEVTWRPSETAFKISVDFSAKLK